MAFTPANVALPAHGTILDQDDHAYYTDTLGNLVPAVVAVVPDSSNKLNALQGSGVLATTDLEVHVASTIDGMSRPPFFKTAGGQKLPIMALMGFDAAKNLVPLDGASNMSSFSHGDYATGGSVGTAPLTVDIAGVLLIAQATASQTLTLPSPTTTAQVRMVIVANTGSVAFTVLGASVAAGAAQMALWTGSAWAAVA